MTFMKYMFKEMRASAPDQRHYLLGESMETSLATRQHVELTHSAAFELLYSREGRSLIKAYYEPYLQLAAKHNMTYILEAPTWRANPDWLFKLGYNVDETTVVNRHAVQFLREIQHSKSCDVIISGAIGPRKSQCDSQNNMSPDEAASYHSVQVRALALSDVDIISGVSFTCSDEAIGVVWAARSVGVPVVISFRLEDNGHLPNGESLEQAIERVDAATENYTSHFIVHCADLDVFCHLLEEGGNWTKRLHGLREPVACSAPGGILTHPCRDTTSQEFQRMVAIKKQLPNFQIIGGCTQKSGYELEELCRLFNAPD